MGTHSALYLPTSSCFSLQSAWENAVDLSGFPQFIFPPLRNKCSLHFLTFGCSICVSDLSLLSSMPAAAAALALSPGEVSLSGWFGCRVNAGGLALPSCGASGQKEGWHLGLGAQIGALIPEFKGGGESSHVSCRAGMKKGAQRSCSSPGGHECLSKLQDSHFVSCHY